MTTPTPASSSTRRASSTSASEYERQSTAARSEEVGQLVKLDPRKPDDPLVWKVDDHEILGQSGIWGTPAIADGVVYADTNQGRVMGVDQKTGKILWSKQLPGPTWQSPVVVDDVLIQGDCNGVLHGYDVSNPRGRAEGAVDGRAGWLHRVDTRRVEGPHLRRHARREVLRDG